MSQHPSASLPEQCIQCAHSAVRGGYVVLPARDVCAAAEQLASGSLAEVLSHLLRVAARIERCPMHSDVGELADDAYRAADAAPPLGRPL